MTTRQRSNRAGYVIAIVINLVLLFVFHQLPNWNLPFITQAWPDVLWAFDLSIGATIAANLAYLAYDTPWFKHITQIVLNILALVVIYTLYRVFPFDFGPTGDWIARIVLLIGLFGVGVAVIIEVIGLIRSRSE